MAAEAAKLPPNLVQLHFDEGTVDVYAVDDLFQYDREFFKGCHDQGKVVRKKFFGKHAVPDADHFFGMEKSPGVWKAFSASVTKARILLRPSWVHAHMPSMRVNEAGVVVGEVRQRYPDAPPLLQLEEHEKFRREDGSAMEVETRGERHWERIYYRADDVGRGLGIDRLLDVVLNPDGGYEEGLDYVRFAGPTQAEQIFLTHNGVLRVMFTNAQFQPWVARTLFSHQMGTQEQKMEVVVDSLGMLHEDLVGALNYIGSKQLGCSYFFVLGRVRDLRGGKHLPIPADANDEDWVCTYGWTDDLARRTQQLQRDYGRIEGVKLHLLYGTLIDPLFQAQAEEAAAEFFDCVGLRLQLNFTGDSAKLVVISADKVKEALLNRNGVKAFYNKLDQDYGGDGAESQPAAAERELGRMMEIIGHQQRAKRLS